MRLCISLPILQGRFNLLPMLVSAILLNERFPIEHRGNIKNASQYICALQFFVFFISYYNIFHRQIVLPGLYFHVDEVMRYIWWWHESFKYNLPLCVNLLFLRNLLNTQLVHEVC